MQNNYVPKSELDSRMARFLQEMDAAYGDWELCAFVGGVSMFYLTGTICDGLLLIRRGIGATLWVRRSYERAVIESEFGDIRRMRSFRDISNEIAPLPDTLYLDTAQATLEWFGMLSKYLPFKDIKPNDKVMLKARAVKSEYELERMRRAGEILDRLLREELASLLHTGISEADLGAELFPLFMRNEYHGVCRFSMRGIIPVLGHVSFGESPLYPSIFNGASGVKGLCPAVPVLGNRDRLLRGGDLIYIDVGFGVDGYNIDKTRIFSYKHQQPEHVLFAHQHCLELEQMAAAMLQPGVKPSDIYEKVTSSVNPEFKSCFMGATGRQVPFIGHSVGLYVDEFPVIAKGFDDPLEVGMTIALEPKIGIDGVGMVGSENTYLVTESGGKTLTGEATDITII